MAKCSSLTAFYTFSEQQPKAIEDKVCLHQSWSLCTERWKVQKYVLFLEYLKCIWNEIFDYDFIGPFESAFEDKTITVYRLWISGLDPKLWRSEVVKIVNFRVKNWQEIRHKINKNWSNLWRHNRVFPRPWWYGGGLVPPPYGGGQVQGDKAVIGGEGHILYGGGTYTLWGGLILRIVFNPKR